MACACKAINKKDPNIEEAKYQKKGVFFFLDIIKNMLLKIVEKLFVIVLFIILVPIIIIMLIVSYVFTGQLRVVLPQKLLNVMKRIDKDE